MFTFPESFIAALKVENNVESKRALISDSEVKELADMFSTFKAAINHSLQHAEYKACSDSLP